MYHLYCDVDGCVGRDRAAFKPRETRIEYMMVPVVCVCGGWTGRTRRGMTWDENTHKVYYVEGENL